MNEPTMSDPPCPHCGWTHIEGDPLSLADVRCVLDQRDKALAEVERLRAERDAALAMLRHTASILDSCGKTSPHYQRTQREYEPGHGGEHCLCRWCAAARTVTDVAALLDGAEEVSDAE